MADWLSLVIAVLALFISVASFALSWLQHPWRRAPIERIIKDEARLTREGDVDGIVQLFTDDAVIRQKHPTQAWIDKDRIRERYEAYRDNASFPELEHLGIDVQFDRLEKIATATSSSHGKFQ